MQTGFLIFSIVVLIISIVVHEVSHGAMANLLGDPTAKLSGRLTLNPIPHIDPIGSVLIPMMLVLTQANFFFGWAKPVPYNPYNLKNQRWGEPLVALAGPASNIIIAVVFAVLLRIFGDTLGAGFSALFTVIIFINLFLGMFNLVPLPPLDGYKVLTGILPYSMAARLRNVEMRMQSLGFAGLAIMLMFFIFVFSQPFFVLVHSVFSLLTGM